MYKTELRCWGGFGKIVRTPGKILATPLTGFGKSLIFHVLSDVFDFVDAKGPPVKGKAITFVISSPNTQMRDQICKLPVVRSYFLSHVTDCPVRSVFTVLTENQSDPDLSQGVPELFSPSVMRKREEP